MDCIVVQLQIVGTVEAWETAYTRIYTPRSSQGSFKDAFRAGVRELDHDDFWIAEVVSSPLVGIRHSNGERGRGATPEELRSAVATVQGVARALDLKWSGNRAVRT